jgi:hypothetical protein
MLEEVEEVVEEEIKYHHLVIFAKVAARYAPLALPAVLHDLPEKYMKSLPKFTGEGDLTAQEHINFFRSIHRHFGNIT